MPLIRTAWHASISVMPSKSNRETSLDGRRGSSSCWIMHGWKEPGVRVDWVMVLFVYCVQTTPPLPQFSWCKQHRVQTLLWQPGHTVRQELYKRADMSLYQRGQSRGVLATHTELISLHAALCKSHKTSHIISACPHIIIYNTQETIPMMYSRYTNQYLI